MPVPTILGVRAMEMSKVLCYTAMAIAGLVCLIFLLDAAVGVLGRTSILLDVLFIVGGAFVLWQGIETTRELR